jgi:hypothetical protein
MRKKIWMKPFLKLTITENFIYTVIWGLVIIYLWDNPYIHIDGIIITVLAFIACILNCLFIKIEETPCNATIQLLSKVIIVLRFLLVMSILLRVDERTTWDWSTTFWPYWCSFAI